MPGSRSRRSGKPGGLSRLAMRFAPFGAFAGLGGVAFLDASYFLATLCGFGAVYTGRRLLDVEGNARRELRRRVRENTRSLREVARRDRVAAPQMERLAALQGSVLESWELMPDEYRDLLDRDIYTIVEEIEEAVWLARRRAAIRDYLAGLDRGEIQRRISGLERDVEDLPEGSMLRASFESTLTGRRNELEGAREMSNGISLINAQLEGAESLLGSLRGDLLTMNTSLAPHMMESGLARLRERVSLFKQSLDEVSHSVGDVPDHGELAGYANGYDDEDDSATRQVRAR